MKEEKNTIFPKDLSEANEICVDLAGRKIPFVLRYNAACLIIRLLTPNVVIPNE